MSIIAASLAMKIALWVVLIAVGLEVLAQLYTGLRTRVGAASLATSVTRPLLVDVLPLLLLALLTRIDPSHFLILVWYYLAAALIAIRALQALSKLLQT